MRKFLFILSFLILIFLFSPSILNKVNAKSSSSQTVTYQGILVKNPNTKYTHMLQDKKINLILSTRYNNWEGKEVKISVVFYEDKTGFVVKSIELVGTIDGVGGIAPVVDGNVVTYQGILIKNPNTNYTHKLKDQNVNFILSSNFNVYENQEVKVQVRFSYNNKFTVISIITL